MRWAAGLAIAGVLVGSFGGPPVAASRGAIAPATAAHGAVAGLAQLDTVFRHAQHTRYACTRCHSGGAVHGEILVRAPADCSACHHAPPVAEPCAGCHRDEAGSARLLEIVRTLRLPGGAAPARALPFRHDLHAGVACAGCHGEPPAVRRDPVDCASCHADHHGATSACTACHAAPPVAAHPLTVHAGCSGSGCHEDAVSALLATALPRSRSACLVCHEDRVDHRPESACAACHVLPPLGLTGPLGLAHPGTRE